MTVPSQKSNVMAYKVPDAIRSKTVGTGVGGTATVAEDFLARQVGEMLFHVEKLRGHP